MKSVSTALRLGPFALFVLSSCSQPQPAPMETNGPKQPACTGSASHDLMGVPEQVLVTARKLVPGFEITEAEREREDGRFCWTLEGMAQGHQIELEILESELTGIR